MRLGKAAGKCGGTRHSGLWGRPPFPAAPELGRESVDGKQHPETISREVRPIEKRRP